MNNQANASTIAILSDAGCAVKAENPKKIKVTIHIPENTSEASRQQKINRIYDILNPRAAR